MIRRSLAVIAVVGALAVQPLGFAAHLPTEQAAQIIRLQDGRTVHTHGPDEAVGPGSQAQDLTGRVPMAARRSAVNCVSAASPHFRGLYVVGNDDVDRSATIVPLLRQAIYDASAFLDAEAAGAGGRARFNVLCDFAGEVHVESRVLPVSSKNMKFSTIVGALQGMGYASTKAKYLVFYDGCVGPEPQDLTDPSPLCSYGGQATIRVDAQAGAGNANNSGPSYAVDYADLLADGPSWATILHEATHTMGGVQHQAPNSTGRFHCSDGLDIMCYDDGDGSGYNESECLLTHYDCGMDDYFSVSPPAGSYLAGHWNIAASYNSFIDHD